MEAFHIVGKFEKLLDIKSELVSSLDRWATLPVTDI